MLKRQLLWLLILKAAEYQRILKSVVDGREKKLWGEDTRTRLDGARCRVVWSLPSLNPDSRVDAM